MRNSLQIVSAAMVLAASGLAAQAPGSAKSTDELRALGARYAKWVVDAEVDSLVAHAASTELADDTRKSLRDMVGTILLRAGSEKALVEERMVKRNKQDQYWRIANYTVLPEPFVVRIVLTPDGRYAGIGIGPLSQVPPVDK